MKFNNTARKFGAGVPVEAANDSVFLTVARSVKRFAPSVAGVAGLLLAGAAMAQTTTPTLDVSTITGFITSAIIPAVTAIGSGILLVYVTAMGFKLVKKAL